MDKYKYDDPISIKIRVHVKVAYKLMGGNPRHVLRYYDGLRHIGYTNAQIARGLELQE